MQSMQYSNCSTEKNRQKEAERIMINVADVLYQICDDKSVYDPDCDDILRVAFMHMYPRAKISYYS